MIGNPEELGAIISANSRDQLALSLQANAPNRRPYLQAKHDRLLPNPYH